MTTADRADTTQAIAGFAAALTELRAEAGEPSFREMARRSGCISHTSLHEATRGTRAPSWETVEQFVLVCGGDVAEWRTRWEALAEPAVGRPVAGTEDQPAGAAETTGREDSSRETAPPRAHSRLSLLGAVLAALIIGATAFGAGYGTRGMVALEATAPTNSSTPDASEQHDSSQFIADVTLADGAQVQAGADVIKAWRLQNVGTTDWTDRYLQRVDGSEGACETPERVIVPETRAGDEVEIPVPIRTPEQPGSCTFHWKMVDSEGKESFPGSRTLFFDIEVV